MEKAQAHIHTQTLAQRHTEFRMNAITTRNCSRFVAKNWRAFT